VERAKNDGGVGVIGREGGRVRERKEGCWFVLRTQGKATSVFLCLSVTDKRGHNQDRKPEIGW
jgi:hypothetical protein